MADIVHHLEPKIWGLILISGALTKLVLRESLSIWLAKNVLADIESGSFPTEIQL